MKQIRHYILTQTAEEDFRDAKKWSKQRWGNDSTKHYFQDLHDAANTLAKNQKQYKAREDLNGDTGLSIHAVREHYLVYIPRGGKQIIIVSLIRQTRDVPSILRSHAVQIKVEIDDIFNQKHW
jgi:plasmid stabilization system protein ParE